MQPLISIVITVLNGESTLENCLRSIQRQTFADYELIIVDGGSTDDTLAIARRYDSPQTTFLVINGISLYGGINAGIDRARGRWIYNMGADDELYDAETLSNLSVHLQDTRLRVVSGNVLYRRQGFLMRPAFGSPYWLNYRLHHQGTFFHRTVFDRFRFDEALRISSDYELTLLVGLAGYPVKAVDCTIALYGEEGISSCNTADGFAEIRLIHRKLFRGTTLRWIQQLCRLQQETWFLRRKWGLLNVKARLNRFAVREAPADPQSAEFTPH